MLTAEQGAFMRAVEAGLRAREADLLRRRPGDHGRPGEAYGKLPESVRERLAGLRSDDVAGLSPQAWMVER